MRRQARMYLLTFCAAFTFVPSKSRGEDAGFNARSASHHLDDDASVQIIGGKKANPDEWVATFILDGNCTSTAIGSQVILTAAHCIGDNSTGSVEYGTFETDVRCHHHPDYKSNKTADFALCFTAKRLPGGRFENLATEPELVSAGSKLWLLGYGCNDQGGTDGGFGVLYEGEATVSGEAAPPSYYVETETGAAVCYGDSGGAAFAFLNPPERSPRVVVGVNSQGNMSTESSVSTTTLPGFADWVRKEADERNIKVCGIDSGAAGCRAP